MTAQHPQDPTADYSGAPTAGVDERELARREHDRKAAQKAADKPGITAGAWVSLIFGALIVVLLLVFIVQNNTPSEFHYFGWQFSLPLGVAMLLAAIAGILIAGIIGSVRIIALNSRIKKMQKALR